MPPTDHRLAPLGATLPPLRWSRIERGERAEGARRRAVGGLTEVEWREPLDLAAGRHGRPRAAPAHDHR